MASATSETRFAFQTATISLGFLPRTLHSPSALRPSFMSVPIAYSSPGAPHMYGPRGVCIALYPIVVCLVFWDVEGLDGTT